MPNGRWALVLSARTVTCIAMICYCVGLNTLVLFPTEDITGVSWIVSVMATICVISLLLRIFRVEYPGAQYTYLTVALTGLFAAVFYDWHVDTPIHAKTHITLFLVAGVIGAFAAHVAQDSDGGL